MVERTKAEGLDEFQGTVLEVTLEPSQLEGMEDQEQFHIFMEPVDKKIMKNSKTGGFHEWIRLSPKATESSVPEGSVADRYIEEIELLIPEAKKKKLITEVFQLLKDKTFLFKKKKLGRSYEGKEAKGYWVPVKLIG